MKNGVPDFVWHIGTEVENLIQRHNALEHWRDRVRSWAVHDTVPTDLIGILYSSSLDTKYTLLAAIHDTCFAPDQACPINPWPEGAPYEVMREGIAYLVLKQLLLPNTSTGTRGLDPSESGRLKGILYDVARSLPVGNASEKGSTPDLEKFIWVCEEALRRFQTAGPDRDSPTTYEVCEAVLKYSKELDLRDPPFRWHTLLREEIGKKPEEVPFDWQNWPHAFQVSIFDICTPWGEYSQQLMSILEETDEVSPEGHRILREVIPNHLRQEGHAAAAAALKVVD